jgi:hypothetical protein
MSFCIPIKESLRYDKSLVGERVITFAKCESVIEMPFSMLITSEAFDEFVKYNQLGPEISWYINATTMKEKIASFQRIYILIANAQFPPRVVESLKECYELMCIDTTNLSNLSMKPSNSLLAMRRSTNFDDKYNVSSPVVFTKETLKQFLESLKKIYLGAFTPSANLCANPNVSIIVSRVPNFKSIIETECDLTSDTIKVKSYLGFPDYVNKVQKNEYLVGLDFLKIQQSSIDYQNNAVVFNSVGNYTELKNFSENQSNSISDQIILEASRLTKIIAKTTNTSFVQAQFMTKDDKIFCTDIVTNFSQKPIELTKEGIIEKEIISQTIANSEIEETIEEEKEMNSDFNIIDNEINNKNNFIEEKNIEEIPVSEAILVGDDVKTDEESTKNLIFSLILFIEKNKTEDMDEKYKNILSKLNIHDLDSIKEAIDLCKEILNK